MSDPSAIPKIMPGPGHVRFSLSGMKDREYAFKHHVKWGADWLAVDGCIMVTWNAEEDNILLAFSE